MTIQDLPPKLQGLKNIRIYTPGEKVHVHLDDAKMTELEKIILPELERKEQNKGA